MACKVFLHAAAVLWLAGTLAAEQLRFDAADEWRTWHLPLGIVALDDVGVIRPVEIRKDVDPVRDAAAFGGGIHAAGSNALAAARAIDGDRLTGWSPDLADDSRRLVDRDRLGTSRGGAPGRADFFGECAAVRAVRRVAFHWGASHRRGRQSH